MPVVRFKSQFSKTDQLLKEIDKRFRRTKDLSPILQKAAKEAQESVRQEFLGSYWNSPSGGKIEWAKRKDNKKHPLLILSRALFLDWTEREPRVTKKTFAIGSDKEYAEVQRGGSTNQISLSPLWKNITPRPHGTHNPELDEKIREMIRQYIAFGTL